MLPPLPSASSLLRTWYISLLLSPPLSHFPLTLHSRRSIRVSLLLMPCRGICLPYSTGCLPSMFAWPLSVFLTLVYLSSVSYSYLFFRFHLSPTLPGSPSTFLFPNPWSPSPHSSYRPPLPALGPGLSPSSCLHFSWLRRFIERTSPFTSFAAGSPSPSSLS